MPSRKRKTKSKHTKSKAATSKQKKKVTPEKRAIAPKRTAKKKQSKKKSASRRRQAPGHRTQRLVSARTERSVSSRQSGDLEGLSRSEQADSESVEELVEEGNVFEAGAVAGVERADDQDTQEVHTREFSEDDVPDEYLDKD